MQMMSDVLDRPIKVASSEQTCALGAAIFGAVASGFYEDTAAAMHVMGSSFEKVYRPIAENVTAYEKVYSKYNDLCLTMEDHIMNQL